MSLSHWLTGGGRPFTKSQCLDFIETAHRDSIYPLVTCQIEYQGQLDVAWLIDAVRQSSMVVPEILYAYDYGRGRFHDIGFTAADVVQDGAGQFEDGWKWDFAKHTQLKILVTDARLVVGISHMLCDGEGFLQYLYLLASLYNGMVPGPAAANSRDIGPMLKGIKVGPATEQEKYGRRCSALPIQGNHAVDSFYCLFTEIAADDLAAIHKKARSRQASLNDIFLTAYARVLCSLLQADSIVLPCPADLRRFSPPATLTVANMSGMYKIGVEVAPDHSFNDTLTKVQNEMHLQKERRRCFANIRLLRLISNQLPPCLINWMVKNTYTVMPLSYTNMGVIDERRLAFDEITITSCFLTGTHRYPPDFQLAISTYSGVCTLDCTLLGTDERKEQGQQILEIVKKELLAWAST